MTTRINSREVDGGSGVPGVVLYPEDFGAFGDGASDDTAAINAMVAEAISRIDAGSVHVIMQFGANEYLLTSAPTHPDGAGGAYAQIPLPKRATTASRAVLEFRGVAGTPITPNEAQTTAQEGGTILRSTSTATRDATYGVPSVIGGPALASSGAAFSNLSVVLSGLTIRRPDNPSIAGADFTWCLQAKTRDLVLDTNVGLGSISYPTATSNIGLLMPEVGNNALSSCEGDLYIFGCYAALRFSEHFTLNHLVAYKNKVAIIPAPGYHGSIIQHANCELNTHVIADIDLTTGGIVPVGASYLVIGMLDVEDAPSGTWAPIDHVYDSSDDLRMLAHFVRVLGGVGTQTGLTIDGGANVHTVDVGAGDGWGGSSPTPLTVKDEGTDLDAAVTSLDLVGAGVTATTDGSGHVTVAIPGIGSSANRWEVLLDGTVDNPQPILTPDGSGWIYVEVPL